jgi:hypothetical protein
MTKKSDSKRGRLSVKKRPVKTGGGGGKSKKHIYRTGGKKKRR